MNAPDRSPWTQRKTTYFAAGLAEADPAMAALVAREGRRQQDELELIASENIVSRAVLEAQGSLVCNKTVEGYPGARYHGGAHVVDEIEDLAIERACTLFGVKHANVQPHSGSQANLAVFKALLEPGDTVLSMDLRAGGHLSHGAKANLSGKVYKIVAYGVRPQDGWLDYEGMEQLALEHRPKLIVAGGSSYPRALDLAAFRRAADKVGAKLLVDMAHFAGLVAGKVLENPATLADVATTTTYKSLRGARGGLILWNDEALTRKLQAAIFPGVQGSPLMHMLAAKAVGLGEALDPSFADYARRVHANAQALAKSLLDHGLKLVTGGTDLPLLLVDLSDRPVDGAAASDFLGKLGLTCNKNLVPNDPRPPQETSGLRFGVSALTTRGLDESELGTIGGWIATALKAMGAGSEEGLAEIRAGVRELAQRHPIYQ
ncbi:MAG TPA: serine hydroxymethyltransferase [Kiloniellales bacterium]|nr:serine hydroxymethyltransferase [Kiloniellales bacterium]